MKKTIAALLIAALAAGLTACGGAAPGLDSGISSSSPSSFPVSAASTPAEGSSSAADESGSLTAADGYTMGAWDGDVYTSEYLGLQIKLPEGWVAATQEELLNLTDMVLDSNLLADQTKLQRELMQQMNIYEMMALDPLTGANILLQISDLRGIPGASAIDAVTFAQAQKNSLAGQMNTPMEFGEIEEMEISGVPYAMLPVYLTEIEKTEIMFCGKYNTRMCLIAITVPSADDGELLEIAMNAIYELDGKPSEYPE